MAPALLKGVVKKTGLTCSTFDFNAETIKFLNDHYADIKPRVIRWFDYEEYNDCVEVQEVIVEIVKYITSRIMTENPKWICLSLFCHTAKKLNVQLCKFIKKNYDVKIVIGGNAVFTDPKSPRPYGKILKKAKLIDHYIVGDGEEPLYNLLTGSSDGVNSETFQALDDLSKQPFSDYDDYNWALYETKRLPMYASRGCVRRCTFCDVYKLWKKFKLRYAEDVFKEMLYQIDKTGITNFYFRDSLVNGSITEYRKLCKLVGDYNKTAEKKIQWTGFFIFRPQEQMPEEDWKLTAESGATLLRIGIETFIDSTRYHMRKKFNNKDILFGLQMAKKYQVGLEFLMIIGYVNETEKDFQESLQWLDNHKEYAGFPLMNLSIGGTLTVTDLTDLYQQAEDYNVTIGNKIHLWENKAINLDYETRERRKIIFLQKAKELGYQVNVDEKPGM
jgi:hypothetical protein